MSLDKNSNRQEEERIDWSALTREEADLAFSNSKSSRTVQPEDAVPNFIKVVKNKSDAARASINNCEFDVAYGESDWESVEILKPDDLAEDAPVLIYFHGGAFHLLSKGDYSMVAPPIVNHGAIFVSVGYTLAPQVSVATIVRQCENAVAFLGKRFPRSRGFYTSGHSAGGNLAVLMVSVDWTKYQLPANLIKGACPFSAMFDLRPFVNTYLNDAIKLSMDEAWEYSPMNPAHVEKAVKYSPDTKIYVVTADHDAPGYKQLSRDYYKMLSKTVMNSKCIELVDTDHFEEIMNLSDEHYEGTKVLLEMMPKIDETLNFATCMKHINFKQMH